MGKSVLNYARSSGTHRPLKNRPHFVTLEMGYDNKTVDEEVTSYLAKRYFYALPLASDYVFLVLA
jgi:hypothetical protein